jgi:hypothetical protein
VVAPPGGSLGHNPVMSDRGSWPVRVYRLGEEPSGDLSATTSPEERLAMVWPLTLEAWAWSGREHPNYSRAETPVVRRPWPGPGRAR